MIALEELGLAHCFDDIYVSSAGFPNASYLLSGNTKLGASIYYENLVNKNFINLTRFWKPVDFDLVVNTIQYTKPIEYRKIWETDTNIYIRFNRLFSKAEYIKVKDFSPNDYFRLLKASISSPIITRGVKINNNRLYDGVINEANFKSLLSKVINSDYTDIVIIYNRNNQKKTDLSNDHRILEILPAVDVSRIETDSLVLEKACMEMKSKLLNLFK